MRADEITNEVFDRLPLVAHGESKIVRALGDGNVAIRFRPTVYSFTANRADEIAGTDLLRMRATRVLCAVLRASDIDHAYLDIGERYAIARRVAPPPIEVIVKAAHVGTPKHRYLGMSEHPVRPSHPRFAGRSIVADGPYPEAWVRFDWRHPVSEPATGRRLADEPLPEPLADLWIDVARAKDTAMRAFAAINAFLAPRGVRMIDVCYFITDDGATVFGELGPDCGRFRSVEGVSLDKDVFRAGGSSERVYSAWNALVERLEERR